MNRSTLKSLLEEMPTTSIIKLAVIAVITIATPLAIGLKFGLAEGIGVICVYVVSTYAILFKLIDVPEVEPPHQPSRSEKVQIVCGLALATMIIVQIIDKI